MKNEQDEIDARLLELAQRSENIKPRAGFSSRVMDQLQREPQPAVLSLRLPARRLLPAGLLAVALAVVWAVSAHDAVNEALAVGYDDVGLEW